MRQVKPAQIPYLTRVLMRTQRMMKAQAYLREHEAAQRVARSAALRPRPSRPPERDRASIAPFPKASASRSTRPGSARRGSASGRPFLARDLASSPASKALLAIRGYGGKAFGASRGTLPEKLQRFGFTSLEEDPGRELVFGIAGKFWRHDGGLRRLADRQAFLDFAEDGCVKAAWNLRIDEDGGRLLRALDRDAHRLLRHGRPPQVPPLLDHDRSVLRCDPDRVAARCPSPRRDGLITGSRPACPHPACASRRSASPR